METTSTKPTRSVDLSVEIDAPADVVWSAITEAEELMRWFPPIAKTDPREGGSITVSWGGGSEWTSHIVVWEPGKHLRLEDELPEEVKDTGVVVALDYWIEGREGGTTLRLVNSGFSGEAEWDDYLAQLNDQGLADVLEVMQSAYERQYGG